MYFCAWMVRGLILNSPMLLLLSSPTRPAWKSVPRIPRVRVMMMTIKLHSKWWRSDRRWWWVCGLIEQRRTSDWVDLHALGNRWHDNRVTTERRRKETHLWHSSHHSMWKRPYQSLGHTRTRLCHPHDKVADYCYYLSPSQEWHSRDQGIHCQHGLGWHKAGW